MSSKHLLKRTRQTYTRSLVSKDIMVTGQHKNLVSNESLKMSSYQHAKVTMLAFRALALSQSK